LKSIAALFLVAASCFLGHAAAAEPGNVLLIHGARVMTMDPVLGDIEDGEVLIRDGRIVAVGRKLAAGAARKIDARGQIVLPGFVDTHNHLYVTTMRGQFRNGDGPFFAVSSKLAAAMTPQDTYTAMRLGAQAGLPPEAAAMLAAVAVARLDRTRQARSGTT